MTEPDETDPRKPLLDAVKALQRWTVILFLLLGAVTVTVFVVRSIDLAHVEESATRNQTALCALRADLRNRVESSQRFLKEHPGGIPGISATQIRDSIEGQRRTIDALKIIDCNEVNVRVGGAVGG